MQEKDEDSTVSQLAQAWIFLATVSEVNSQSVNIHTKKKQILGLINFFHPNILAKHFFSHL